MSDCSNGHHFFFFFFFIYKLWLLSVIQTYNDILQPIKLVSSIGILQIWVHCNKYLYHWFKNENKHLRKERKVNVLFLVGWSFSFCHFYTRWALTVACLERCWSPPQILKRCKFNPFWCFLGQFQSHSPPQTLYGPLQLTIQRSWTCWWLTP